MIYEKLTLPYAATPRLAGAGRDQLVGNGRAVAESTVIVFVGQADLSADGRDDVLRQKEKACMAAKGLAALRTKQPCGSLNRRAVV